MPHSATSQLAAEFPPTSNFVPRQALQTAPSSLRELSGTATAQLAEIAVSYLPPLLHDSFVHDNGCGDGNVTRALLSRISNGIYPQSVWATDVIAASESIGRLNKDAKERDWTVETKIASAEALDFPDNYFTQSVTNSVLIHLSGDGPARACKEIHRTLKPGGVAVISIFAQVPHRPALLGAHHATRPADSLPLVGGAVKWEDGTLLRQILKDGGFQDDNIQIRRARAVIAVDDLKAWESQTWSVLGRTASGWLLGDEESWDNAIHVFSDALEKEDGVELFNEGRSARLTFEAWVAVAEKEM